MKEDDAKELWRSIIANMHEIRASEEASGKWDPKRRTGLADDLRDLAEWIDTGGFIPSLEWR